MKNKERILWVLVGTVIFGGSLNAAKISSIDFKVVNDMSELSILSDSPLEATLRESVGDKQVVIDIPDSTLGPMASRKLDTSSFPSPVSLVSPYQVGNNVRVVAQLSEMQSASLKEMGNEIRVAIGGNANFSGAPAAGGSGSDGQAPADPEAQVSQASGNVTQSQEAKDIDQFLDNQKTRNFTGRAISLQVRDADVRDILRLIAEASGFNIVIGSGVNGTLTLSLIDVPWDHALDVVLNTLRLGAERNGNVLRVLTLANLTAEKVDQLAAKTAAERSAARVTRVFPISYADLGKMSATLTAFGKSGTSGGATGTVGVDERTNSIIVQDIPDNIERMTKLIELLDTQTPQVMVEAKIVEAQEQYSRAIGGSLGFDERTGTGVNFFSSFNGMNPLDGLVGDPGQFADGDAIATATLNGGGLGFSPVLSFISNNARVNAFISIGESESKLQIVSSPKTVVLNRQAAQILQSIPVLVKGTTTTDDGVVQTENVQNANISLNVTPTITNDENVLLNLNISRDVPQDLGNSNSGIGQRNIQTQVLVESGATLVIGGIYISDRFESEVGFPILRHIPIIGYFFGSDTARTNRSELFIFVTPRILNTDKAGLAST